MSRHLLTLVVLLSALAVLGGALGAPRAWAPPGCNPGGGGHGTADDPFLISDAGQLEALAGSNCPFESFYFRQTADIALSGPIDLIGTTALPFNGTYDGGGHRITGLVIPSVVVNDTGLFGAMQSAEIKDLTIAGASISDGASGKSNIGVLAGRMLGSIVSNVHAIDVTVVLSRDDARIGALVGTMDSSSISGASASGTVVSGGPVGGLVGEACASSIASSSSSVAVRSSVGYGAGGLVGDARSSCNNGIQASDCIAPCYAPATIGIFDSQATGAIEGVETVGGLIGFAGPMAIERSFATGAVSGTDGVGGLVGVSSDEPISDAYALGSVTGQNRVGGLVGGYGGASIVRSYAAGRVIGDTLVGGLVGGLGDNVAGPSSAFWDIQASGQAASFRGLGRSTAEMKSLATFADAGWTIGTGWDAARTWEICARANSGYPFLTVSYTAATDPCAVPPTAAAAAATPAGASLKVRTVRVAGNTLVSQATVSGAGTVVQTGGIRALRRTSGTLMVACSVRRTVKAAGSIALRCPLNARTLRLLRRHAVVIRLKTTFAPTAGSAVSSSTTITLPQRPSKPSGSGSTAVTG